MPPARNSSPSSQRRSPSPRAWAIPTLDKNPRLRLAVKEGRANSMPRENIERAIKKATGGDAETYEEIRV